MLSHVAFMPTSSLMLAGLIRSSGGMDAKEAQHQNPPILQLPQEVWQGIIANISYGQDLQALASTCKDLQALVLSHAAQMTITVDASEPDAPLKACQTVTAATSARPANGSLELTLWLYCSGEEDASEQFQHKALTTALKQLGKCPGVWSLRLKVSACTAGVRV
jgi:hypothetical protein